MATSPSMHSSGFLSPLKSKLANRLSGSFHRKSYNHIGTSPSVDDFDLHLSPKTELQNPEFFDFSTSDVNSFIPSREPAHNDYLFTKDNFVVFYVQFTRVEYGLFKDLINLNTPLQEIIDRYAKFFSDTPKLRLFLGPKIGVSHRKFHRTRSLGLGSTRIAHSYSKLAVNSSLSEQNITSSHLLIISPPSDAKFNRDRLRSYQDNKSEETLFVERWLPAVQGSVPLSEDAACVLAASLHTLNSKQSPSVKSTPRDFIHRAVPLSKLSGTKIDKVLEDIKLESVASIQKLCADTILSNYLSAAIVFSVAHSTGGSIPHEQDVYLIISSESVMLIKKSDLSQIISYIQLADIKSWKHNNNTLNIEHVNRFEHSTNNNSHLIIKSRDSAIINTTLSAVGHSLRSQE